MLELQYLAWGGCGGRGLGEVPLPFPGGGWAGSGQCAHLAESDLAVAGAVPRVPDEHLPIVLNPALATQDVVNAGCHLVPLKVVPKPERDSMGGQLTGPGELTPP